MVLLEEKVDFSEFLSTTIGMLSPSLGTDFRRPPTADSAKTSNFGSDDDLSEESN